MWDDAVQMQGRQTKRKWKWIGVLLAAALICMLGSWLAMHPNAIQERVAELRGQIQTDVETEWVQFFSSGYSGTVALVGDLVLSADAEGVAAYNMEGKQRYQTPMDWQEPVIAEAFGYTVAYDPGGTNLLLADADGTLEVGIPQGIDLAVPGPEGLCAVITGGSGYMTETRIFSTSGETLRQIGLTDQAMAMMTFLEDGTLASCCVDRTGTWSLRLDREEDSLELPVSDSMVYEIQSCGEGFALWTNAGIRFYDSQGNCTGSYEIRDDAVLAWDCDDWAAALIRRFGTYRLLTLSPTGEAVEQELDSGLPETLLVCGKWACMLDSEALLVYDKNGTLVQRSVSGARAGGMLSAENGLLLMGDGEMLYMQIS